MSNLAKVKYEPRHILFLKDAEEGQLAESPGWNPKILFHALRAGKHIKRKNMQVVQVPHVGKIVESLDESSAVDCLNKNLGTHMAPLIVEARTPKISAQG
ncbi:hypothetical protein TorRG33x02_012360 [Trema orientale]|uniref:Uncharacterized protein n=1 Tax=Trema orientale TaxID=63057 RepID=A0A2P5FZG3_TREOI|nr:hypothetical protein TorRG33x02_012360 [Trema orientale]